MLLTGVFSAMQIQRQRPLSKHDILRFTSRPRSLPVRLGEEQRRLVDQCAEALGRLEKAIAPWSQTQLDRYLVPHAVLGRLTVREMLMFTLFHFEHHRDTVSRRMGLPLTQRES
jgi:hypothetical protein